MGKRKHSPTRLGDEKRACLSWEISLRDTEDSKDEPSVAAAELSCKEPENLFSSTPSSSDAALPDLHHHNKSAEEDFQLSVWLCETEDRYSFELIVGSSSSVLESYPNFCHLSSLELFIDSTSPEATGTSPPNLENVDQKSSGEVVLRRAGVVAATHSCYSDLGEDTLYAFKQLASWGNILLVVRPQEKILDWQLQHVKCVMSIHVYVSPSSLTPPNSAYSHSGSNGSRALAWKEVMRELFRFQHPASPKNRLTDSVEEVYSFISQECRYTQNENEPAPQAYADKLNETLHPSLLPCLRGYQQRAVVWMLERERKDPNLPTGRPHPIWKEVHCADGKTIYYNPFTSKLTSVRFDPPPDCLGGILADEMGLGKTVEVLSCLLCNPYNGKEFVDRTQSYRPLLSTQVKGELYESPNVDRVYKPSQRKVEAVHSSPVKNNNTTPNSSSPLGSSLSSATPCKSTSGDLTASNSTSCDASASEDLTPSNGMSSGALASRDLSASNSMSSGASASEDLVASNSILCVVSASEGLTADGSISCAVSASEKLTAGCSMSCDASANEDFTASNSTSCGALTGEDLTASNGTSCGALTGEDLTVGNSTSCGALTGVDLTASNRTSCGAYTGEGLTAGNSTSCGALTGVDLTASNRTSCGALTSEYLTAGNSTFCGALTSEDLTASNRTSCGPLTGKDLTAGNSTSCGALTNEDLTASNRTSCSALTSEDLTASNSTSCGALTSGDVTASNSTSCGASTSEDVTASNSTSCGTGKSHMDNDKESAALYPTDSEGPCLCNAKLRADKRNVFCVRCRGWQHKSCVEFNDLLTETNFICPQCWASREPLPCRTTLIVSPSSISGQWMDEIRRHVKHGALQCMEYRGVAAQGYINPSVLATYDIIITTYHVLQTDLAHALLRFGKDDRPRRHTRKYIAMPSPLIGLQFWRVCLDEAQMVESTNAKAAMMADKLSAVHRWCVTGTPINRGIHDLYGLLYFLDVWPYCHQVWWNKTVYNPFCNDDIAPLQKLLTKLMWRNAKKDVFHELGIPEQKCTDHWLKFGAVERHYYKRQLEACSRRLLSVIERNRLENVALKLLNKDTAVKLMHPLLQLRQACCHPHIVRSGHWALTRKDGMTMEAVLDQLIKKAKIECTDANRSLLASLNGLAGVHAIKKEWARAVDVYREVLTLAKERPDLYQADTMQKIHALHNLREMLPAAYAQCCGRSLNEDNLETEEKELRKHYLAKYAAEVEMTYRGLQNLRQTAFPIEEHVAENNMWYLTVLEVLDSCGMGDVVLDAVLQAATAQGSLSKGFVGKFKEVTGLKLLLVNRLKELEEAHDEAVEMLEELQWDTSPGLIAEAVRCHLNVPRGYLPDEYCRLCNCEQLLSLYEQELFHTSNASGHVNDDAPGPSSGTQQTWQVSELELILKAIHKLTTDKRCVDRLDEELVVDGQRHLALFEHRRKEFKTLRRLWTSLCSRVGALDELNSCVSRLTTERRRDTPLALLLDPAEVPAQQEEFKRQRAAAESDLKCAIGQLVYLQNLAKAGQLEGEVNKDLCPVCTTELGYEWYVCVCGHCYCCQCIDVMIGRRVSAKSTMKCPICRSVSAMHEISFVQVASRKLTSEKEEFPVKGSHSTKVEEVVRKLMAIQQKEPGAKTLVFSTWNEVLSLIQKALVQNDVMHASLLPFRGARQLQTVLNTFKSDPGVNVLLLNFKAGANGLNLIEATHVVLVEPSLSPASELQAIGRVHRIGQTKPTTVHRFLVKNTVEERLHKLLSCTPITFKSPTKNEDSGNLTVGDLTVLLANRHRFGEDSDNEEYELPSSAIHVHSDSDSNDSVSASDSDYFNDDEQTSNLVEDLHWSDYSVSRRLYQ